MSRTPPRQPKSRAAAPAPAAPSAAVSAQNALTEGVVDAMGFVGGALLGWQWGRWLGFGQWGRWLGFDVLAPDEWTSRSLIGWALLLAGCGLGKWVTLQWRRHRAERSAPKN